MAFTYDVSTNLGKTRLEVGDTVQSDGVLPDGSNLTDAEINYYLGVEPSVYAASASVCRMLATRWAREATKSIGDYSASFSDVAKMYSQRAIELGRLAGRGAIWAGGISEDRKDVVEDDTDRVEPAFTRDLDKALEQETLEREDD